VTRIVCISDTHNRLSRVKVPDGDILIHAGDATMAGRSEEIDKFDEDLERLPHKHKIVIAGNHDWLFQTHPAEARRRITAATYLEDSEVTVCGLRIYGSPWQPEFCNWAFNLDRGEDLYEKWEKIPAKVDILITHGPPAKVLDRCPDGRQVGCADLEAAILDRVRPRLHVFGHIHHSYGQQDFEGMTFVNASVCNERYEPRNAPIVVDL
jgi:Icc-related predicted phosphoesterase